MVGIQIAGSGAPEIVVAAASDGDTIVAGDGRNLVFGDAGDISAAADDTPRFGTHLPITLGRVTSVATQVGGSDSITTGIGADIVIGGIDADTIVANFGETALRPDGNNIVVGDNGLIDWAARERGGLLAGDDNSAADIDRIWSLDPDVGGNDLITTGTGDDIVIAGEDGELIVGIEIAGSGAPEVITTTATNGDTVVAGNGHNIVFGDNGEISAAAANVPQFSSQPITLGLVTSTAPTQGGNDSITTGTGRDIVHRRHARRHDQRR